MEAIVRRKLSHEVLDRLIGAIEAGEYEPGTQLPSERELMARFGVGRPAIREAMQTLQQMGLIRINHGERARVILPTPETIIDQITGAMLQLLSSNPRGLNDLKEARIFFEVGLARVATQRATRDSLEQLRRSLIACQEARGDAARFVAADMAFHRQIASMSSNLLIAAISQGMLDWLSRFKRELVSARGAERLTLEEHERIYKAIAAGDAEAAAKAMSDHLTRANALYSVLAMTQPEH
ncbi:transcriptional regulator NanR [Microvirga sp. GCM10011540]|uniref:transcriptional regulator NanR n=1 Tax=Microvirga sp. GCM10011540 TaxID=3317338 RepID=UPI003620360B